MNPVRGLKRLLGDLRSYRREWRGKVSLVDALRLMRSIRFMYAAGGPRRGYDVQLRVSPGIRVQIRPGYHGDAGELRDVLVAREHMPPWPDRPSRILDVGAGTGLTTADYLCSFPDARVVAVEPQPDLLPILGRNCSPWAGRYTVRAAAVWTEEAGRMELSGSLHTSIGAALSQVHEYSPAPPDLRRLEVETTTMQSLCREYGPFDFAKIDIEGAEARVLPTIGAWADLIEGLAIELHPGRTGFGVDDASAVLEAAGYRLAGTSGDERRPVLYARKR